MTKDKKTPKSTQEKTLSDYQTSKKPAAKVDIISTGKTSTKKGK